MDAKKIINDHLEQQAKDLVKAAKAKSMTPGSLLKLKHKYMERCKKIWQLSLYAVKYNDGTDRRLFDQSLRRKKFYTQKLIGNV